MAEVDLSLDTEKESQKARAEALRKSLEGDDKEGGWLSPLSPTEKALQGLFLGLGALDWGQTVNFTQHRKADLYETNPILGKNPSRAKVNILIPLGLALHTGAVQVLPRPYRNIVQGLGIAGEGLAVGTSFAKGVKPIWPWK